MTPFTLVEIDQLAAELGPLYGPLVVFAAETALRPAEWLAVHRSDVDRSQGVVVVERTLGPEGVKPYAKTDFSRRRVPLSSRALAALDDLPRRLDTRLVFPAESGGHLDLDNWRRREWKPALEAAGVAKRRPYDLRHTAISNWLAAGLSVFEVSRYAGTSLAMISCLRTPGARPRSERASAAGCLRARVCRDCAARCRRDRLAQPAASRMATRLAG
jgi:integrase